METDDRHRRAALLRRIDGVPHVLLGPALLAVLAPLERWTGASRRSLAAILVPFTAYGVVVLIGTRELEAPRLRWLVPVAITANAAAVAVGAAAVAHRGVTPLGRTDRRTIGIAGSR